jgi:Caulimovirus viroplasmin
VGILKRLLIPRPVRKALAPARTAKRAVKRAVVPKSLRKASRAAFVTTHPLKAAKQGVEDAAMGAVQGRGRTRRRPSPKFQPPGESMTTGRVYVVTSPTSVRGIYLTWAECEAAVKGVSGAQPRRVASLGEAETMLWMDLLNSPPPAPPGSTS